MGNRHGADTDGAGRQGPCPAGFHVPGVGEWDVLLEYRRSVSSGDFPEATLNNP